MAMDKRATRRVGGPAWRPGEPTLTVSEIAEALAPIAPDIPGTIQRIRHWTREQMMLPVGELHSGSGKHRQYAAAAVYDAAILHVLASAGFSVSSHRELVDALSKARFEIAEWKPAKKKPLRLELIIARTAAGMAQLGVYTEDEEIVDHRGFKVADVVLTVKVDLKKLFAQVDSHGGS
jgi:DNA-binding transcriptional MerR regulator